MGCCGRLSKLIKYYKLLVALLIGSLISYFCVVNWGVSLAVVNGPSMEPAYYDLDKVLVSRYTLLFRNPVRGEVVIIWQPTMDDGYDIKRVAAVPGDSVQEPDGRMRPLSKDQYFILGDNTNKSYDSRHYGPVHRVQIVGVVKE